MKSGTSAAASAAVSGPNRSVRMRLYLEHMMPIIDHVLQRGVRPILWDDMLRKWPMSLLETIAPKVDLMCWSYKANPFEWLRQEPLDNFQAAGIHLWAGAAFKGADGITADLPDDRQRMSNMQAWAQYAVDNNWEGMIATGWSRYNGLATYCELWQAAPMALYLAAEVMRNGSYESGDWDKACRETIGVTDLPVDWSKGRTPRATLDAAAGKTENNRLAGLKAIAAVAQWQQIARHICNEGQSFAYPEDPGRYNEEQIARLRQGARNHAADWENIRQEFEQAIGQGMYPRDVTDYLASRRRMGMQSLQPMLDEH